MADDRHAPTLESAALSVKSYDPTAPEPRTEIELAATIIDVTRDLMRTVPAPRTAPYFYLDSDATYDPQVLDALCARGIFRKYEFALDIGSGLGGRTRWLAARFGCRVLGLDPRPAMVAAAALLNRRARRDDQVAFQAGCPGALPLRAGVFTHVWMIDLVDGSTEAAAYEEALRVLRPGGHFTLQCALPSRDGVDALLAILRRTGFVELETSHGGFPELPSALRLARGRLRVALRQKPGAAALWQRLERRQDGDLRVLISARRLA